MVRTLTIADIQDRIREAADTLWRLPDSDRRFLSAGQRGSWPGYVRDWHAYGADKARAPRATATSEAIDRMYETIGWIAWLASQDEREAKIVWAAFGMRTSTRKIVRELGIARKTVDRDKMAGLWRILGYVREKAA